MKEKFQKMVDSRFGVCADKFCNSVWYIAAIGAVCVLCHSLDIPVVGAALLTLLVVPALVFCKNSFVLMPFLMMCSFVISEETMPQSGYYNTPLNISALCIMLVFIIAALGFNLVYFGKWRVIFKKAYFSGSLAILSAVLMLGGIGSPTFSTMGLGTAIAIAITMFLPYSMLINCGEYSGRKTVEYFAYATIVAATVIFAAVIKQYIKYDLNLNYHPKDLIVFGYAISNTAAAIVLISVPMTFYMVYVYKHGYVFMPVIAMEAITIALTFSRASLVVLLPGVLTVAIGMCFKKKTGRIGYWIAFGIAVIAIIAIAVYFRTWIYDKILALFGGDSTGSGRTRIWRRGFNAWKEYPIFGVGIGYLPSLNYRYYSFHCTPLTYLFCGGIVGLIGYIYHRYKTARMVFSAKLTAERVFVALTVLAMLFNALLDIAMTSPPHLLYYGIMLALIECDVKREKAGAELADPSANMHDDRNASEISDTSITNEACENTTFTEGEI